MHGVVITVCTGCLHAFTEFVLPVVYHVLLYGRPLLLRLVYSMALCRPCIIIVIDSVGGVRVVVEC